MAEYIERERLTVRVLGLTIVDPMVAQYADAVLLQIQQAPAADVVPVVHGRWLYELADNGWTNYMCSKCGYQRNVDVHVVMDWDYCPYCGARMDGDSDEG